MKCAKLPNASRSILLAAILIVLAVLVAQAQTDTDFTIADLQGVRSKIAMQEAAHQADASNRQWNLIAARREQGVLRHRQEVLIALTSLKAHKSPTKRSKPTVIVSTFENVILTFVTPKGAPVTGVTFAAAIDTPGRPGHSIGNVVTDEQGKVRIANVGPLPASVDLTPQDSTSNTSSVASQASEWQFADTNDSSFLIASAKGQRIVYIKGWQYPPAGSRPIRVATTDLMSLSLHRFRDDVISRDSPAHMVAVYEFKNPDPIVLQRNYTDLDVSAEPGSEVAVAGLDGQEFTTDEAGHAAVRIPISLVADGPVAIRVGRMLTGGEEESVITDYGTDPYSLNSVQAPPMRLVRLSSCDIPSRVGVLDPLSAVQAAFGTGRMEKVTSGPDGSQWHSYPKTGLSFKVRKIPNNIAIVERLRVTAPGGLVGGIGVGSSTTDLRESLGEPDSDEPMSSDNTGVTVASYLDDGLRIGHDAETVRWIELARPTQLLTGGTTAFVPRPQARLYVSSFQGSNTGLLRTQQDLLDYLSRIPSIRLVSSEDDSDLVLDLKVNEFTQTKDDILIGALPFKYDCKTSISYSLRDNRTGEYLCTDKPAESEAGVDFTGEAVVGVVALAILARQKGDVGKLLAVAIGLGGADELQQNVKQAVNRCPGIATQNVLGAMAVDIAHASDFSMRVTSVDYQRGLLTLNAGTEDGIPALGIGQPAEFEVLVGDVPLPSTETGNNANYYTAVAISVSDHSTVCELRHVQRSFSGSRERIDQKVDLEMARRIPDPVTGIVSASALVRFPSVDIVQDSDLCAADAADDDLVKSLISSGQLQPSATTAGQSDPEYIFVAPHSNNEDLQVPEQTQGDQHSMLKTPHTTNTIEDTDRHTVAGPKSANNSTVSTQKDRTWQPGTPAATVPEPGAFTPSVPIATGAPTFDSLRTRTPTVNLNPTNSATIDHRDSVDPHPMRGFVPQTTLPPSETRQSRSQSNSSTNKGTSKATRR